MFSNTGSPWGSKSHALPLVFTTRVYPASFLWIDWISPSIGKSVPAASGVMPAGSSSVPSSVSVTGDLLGVMLLRRCTKETCLPSLTNSISIFSSSYSLLIISSTSLAFSKSISPRFFFSSSSLNKCNVSTTGTVKMTLLISVIFGSNSASRNLLNPKTLIKYLGWPDGWIISSLGATPPFTPFSSRPMRTTRLPIRGRGSYSLPLSP